MGAEQQHCYNGGERTGQSEGWYVVTYRDPEGKPDFTYLMRRRPDRVARDAKRTAERLEVVEWERIVQSVEPDTAVQLEQLRGTPTLATLAALPQTAETFDLYRLMPGDPALRESDVLLGLLARH